MKKNLLWGAGKERQQPSTLAGVQHAILRLMRNCAAGLTPLRGWYRPVNGGSMKLKQRDWSEHERRLAAAPKPGQQNDMVGVSLLITAVFGVVALAAVVGYLLFSSLAQDAHAREREMHFWRERAK